MKQNDPDTKIKHMSIVGVEWFSKWILKNTIVQLSLNDFKIEFSSQWKNLPQSMQAPTESNLFFKINDAISLNGSF